MGLNNHSIFLSQKQSVEKDTFIPDQVSILLKPTSDRYRPDRSPVGPITVFLIMLVFNDTSILVVILCRLPEKEKRDRRDRRDRRGDERQGQGRKRNSNENEETEEIKTFPLCLLKG